LQQAQQRVEGFGAVAFEGALQHLPCVQHGHALNGLGVLMRFGSAFECLQPRLQVRDDAEGLPPLAQRLLALTEFEVRLVVAFGRAGQQGHRAAWFRRVQCAFADRARLATRRDAPAQLQGRFGLLGGVVCKQLPAQHDLAAFQGVFVHHGGYAHAERACIQHFGRRRGVRAQCGARLRQAACERVEPARKEGGQPLREGARRAQARLYRLAMRLPARFGLD
jgi:hypothetical protein